MRRMDRDLVRAHLDLGRIHARAGEHARAHELLERALSLEPENVEALFGLANLCRARDEPDRAAALYREILALDAGHEEASYFLCVVTGGAPTASIPESLVRGLFDEYAPTYDEHLRDHLRYRVPELLRDLLRRLPLPEREPGTVVDLGCGTGLCGPLLRDLAAHLVGVDLSPGMIEVARARGIYDELRSGEVREVLRSAGWTVDLAVAADLAVYLGDLHSLFSEVRAVLGPGGRFVLNVEIAAGGEPYELLPGGRIAHRREYVEQVAAHAELTMERRERGVARLEEGRDVICDLYALRRPN